MGSSALSALAQTQAGIAWRQAQIVKKPEAVGCPTAKIGLNKCESTFSAAECSKHESIWNVLSGFIMKLSTVYSPVHCTGRCCTILTSQIVRQQSPFTRFTCYHRAQVPIMHPRLNASVSCGLGDILRHGRHSRSVQKPRLIAPEKLR